RPRPRGAVGHAPLPTALGVVRRRRDRTNGRRAMTATLGTPPHTPPNQEHVAVHMAETLPRGPRQLVRQAAADYRLVRATKYGLTPLVVIFVLDLVQSFDSRVP